MVLGVLFGDGKGDLKFFRKSIWGGDVEGIRCIWAGRCILGSIYCGIYTVSDGLEIFSKITFWNRPASGYTLGRELYGFGGYCIGSSDQTPFGVRHEFFRKSSLRFRWCAGIGGAREFGGYSMCRLIY